MGQDVFRPNRESFGEPIVSVCMIENKGNVTWQRRHEPDYTWLWTLLSSIEEVIDHECSILSGLEHGWLIKVSDCSVPNICVLCSLYSTNKLQSVIADKSTKKSISQKNVLPENFLRWPTLKSLRKGKSYIHHVDTSSTYIIQIFCLCV